MRGVCSSKRMIREILGFPKRTIPRPSPLDTPRTAVRMNSPSHQEASQDVLLLRHCLAGG